ncbi:MAG: hypothetical protein AABX63_01960 [Nanoarchaeota archaeon]
MFKKTFKSDTNSFTLKFPYSWTYHPDPDSDGSTIMFWRKNGGMGTLRLTPLAISGGKVEPIISDYLSGYRKKVKKAKYYTKEGTSYLEYRESKVKTDKDIEMYYWYVSKKDIFLILSFTTLKAEKNNPKLLKDLKDANSIVKSIKIM